jgi:hypothetical protein
MNIMQKVSRFLNPPAPKNYYLFQVKCERCGEVIEGRINVANDPSLEYEGATPIYICRKVLIGSGHCYQQVEVCLKFDANRKLLDRQISGGKFFEQ